MKTASDPIDWNPQRIAVSGVSGVGKTTLCKQIAALSGFPRVELDSLYHGKTGLRVRPSLKRYRISSKVRSG